MSMFKPFLNKKHAESSLQVPNSYIILDKSYSRKRNEMELSMILSCNHINKAFGTDEILSEVSFHIEDQEKAAIVGINGAGKSTLLKIIVGELAADSGEVVLAKGKTLGYLAQHQDLDSSRTIYEELKEVKQPIIDMEQQIRELEVNMQNASGEELEQMLSAYSRLSHTFELENGYAWKSELTGVLKGLGFTEEEFDKTVSTLSGGQKTRVSLGKLLLSRPDIILLDEPTNHLDMPTIEWLEGYLKNYPKAVVIVSHDRMFLDRVIDVTYEIEYHRIRRYPGNYTAFLRQKEEALAKQEKDYEAQQAEIKRLTDWIEKWKNTPTKVAATRSKRKVIEHMILIEKPRKFDTKAFQGQFLPQTASYHDVLSVRGLQIGYDSVLSKVSFELHRMERIAVIGENGKGKSTLLKTLVGELPKLGGQFSFGTGVEWGYFDQQAAVAESQNPKMTIMEDFWEEYPTLKEVEVRSALGSFLFSGDDVYKELGQLSGGEKVRLALCKMFKRRPNLLILDEPTNHMDIVGKEALEQMLKSYTGTVLFVSHDRYFIKEIATGILDFQADKVQYYPCTYEEYLEQKQKEAQGLIGGNKTNAAGNSGKSRNVAGEAADNRNISQVGSQSNPPT